MLENHNRFMTKLLLNLACGLIFLSQLSVQPQAKERPEKVGTFTFQFENDLFYGADRNYTNGLRLSWISPNKDNGDPVPLARGLLQKISLNNNPKSRLSLAIAQEMYTPTDRRRADLILDDRPYAGWLYLAAGLHTKNDSGFKPFDKMLDSVEFDIGIIGPHAYAKEAQDWIHDIRVIDRFDGWSNQLQDELGVLLMYERKWRATNKTVVYEDLEFDFIPHAGASIGNVLTHVNLGGELRFGFNIPDDFGRPSLIKGLGHMDINRDKGSWRIYAYAGAEGRYVAHSIFLDGNTLLRSHSVDRKPWVGELSFGLAFEIAQFRVSYSSILRTREFEGQADNSRFGSIAVSWQF